MMTQVAALNQLEQQAVSKKLHDVKAEEVQTNQRPSPKTVAKALARTWLAQD
jgi:hypothetical protein